MQKNGRKNVALQIAPPADDGDRAGREDAPVAVDERAAAVGYDAALGLPPELRHGLHYVERGRHLPWSAVAQQPSVRVDGEIVLVRILWDDPLERASTFPKKIPTLSSIWNKSPLPTLSTVVAAPFL